MNPRFWLLLVVLPGVLSLAVLAAIVLSDGEHLGWGRFGIGMGAYVITNIGAAVLGGLHVRRRVERS
ncbi:hypothetical protein AB0C91_10125 [Streptomyces sp. NPDC048674]|uniref:hypothetical protein n=1 Tax=Streptomyces sp. NPDC048674 TaxID=3155491 RepID=UPI0034303466